eukprot:1377367-Amphidinium_carterae.1
MLAVSKHIARRVTHRSLLVLAGVSTPCLPILAILASSPGPRPGGGLASTTGVSPPGGGCPLSYL